jgi:hypothetical protein
LNLDFYSDLRKLVAQKSKEFIELDKDGKLGTNWRYLKSNFKRDLKKFLIKEI